MNSPRIAQGPRREVPDHYPAAVKRNLDRTAVPPVPDEEFKEMADLQVTCINKQPRQNPHEGITHLGGPGNGGWWWTRQRVISSINARENTFYTKVSGNRAEVGVVDGPNGQYLRTHADGKWNDNLLALPECRQR